MNRVKKKKNKSINILNKYNKINLKIYSTYQQREN